MAALHDRRLLEARIQTQEESGLEEAIVIITSPQSYDALRLALVQTALE